jgi:hypothetical protein
MAKTSSFPPELQQKLGQLQNFVPYKEVKP